MLTSRKATSPVLATLLMVAVAISMAILAYVWTIGLTGSLMGGGGSQVKEQLIMEAYSWNATSNALSITLRNVGATALTVAATYVGGNAITFGGLGAGTSINVGNAVTGSATVAGTNGVAYVLKIITQTGGVFSFSVIAGSSG